MSTYSEHRSVPHGFLQPADMGLRDYWHALYSQRWLIALITAAIVVLVGLVTLLITPSYRASSTLQIERDTLNVVKVESLMPVESPQDKDFYQTQYQLLQSRSLARAVIREAKLDQEPTLKPVVDEAMEKMQAATRERGGELITRQSVAERVLTPLLLSGLDVEPILNSRLVYINFDSPDPALAAKIVNAYARVFIVSSQERRLQASTFATQYLSERLAQLRARVEESEKGLVDYSSQERIVSVGDDKLSLPAQNLTELNALLASAQDARIKAEAGWRQATSGNGLGMPQAIANPLIQNLRAEQVKIDTEYQQKLSTFKPQYPEMQQLLSQRNELQRQIDSELVNIRGSLKAEYETARQQEQMLEARIGTLKNDELDLQSRSIRYNMLKREVDTNRQLYDALLQRYKEIGIAGNIGSNNISIVDMADVPGTPSSPKWLLNLAIGFIFGAFLAVAFALLRYFLREEKQ
jgi:GumC protein